MSYLFKSERLGFRNWSEEDLPLLIKMNQNEQVMEFLLGPISKEKSEISYNSLSKFYNINGYTYFATFLLKTNEFIGFIGLKLAAFESYFTPCVDIGWRIDLPFWGKGYATEGAKKMIQKAPSWNINEIYSFTPIANTRSENVMIKCGMNHVGYFDHPLIDVDSNLRRHTLYKIDL